MASRSNSFVEKVYTHLYDSVEDLEKIFKPSEVARLQRYKDIYAKWINDPTLTDSQIIHYIKNHHKLSVTQCYRDIAEIKSLLGNVTTAAKEFKRYTAEQMIKSGYQKAKDAKDKFDIWKAEQMIKAGKAFGDVNRLNKMDPQDIPFEEIIPAEFEPEYNPALLDKEGTIKISKTPDEYEILREKMNRKYFKEDNITDANIVSDESED